MSVANDDRTKEEKRQKVRELLHDPTWRERSNDWVAKEAGVHWEIVAEERRALDLLPMNGKLLGKDGKWYLCGKGRIRRDRAQLNGERTASLVTLYDAVVRQLASGHFDPDELKRLTQRAAAAAGYHREILKRCSFKRRRAK